MQGLTTYVTKGGRVLAYLKDEKKVVSYPRIVMEEYLGRKLLQNEDVHHVDGNPLNNKIENLKIVSRSAHMTIHGEQRYTQYEDKVVTCPICGAEFVWTATQQRTHAYNIERAGREHRQAGPFCSRRCSGIYGARVQKENRSKDDH